MAQTRHPQSITAALDATLNTMRAWLVPTVEGQCARPDAAKLRVLVDNLAQTRDIVAEAETGMPGDASLSGFFEAAAERYAVHGQGLTLDRAAIIELVAVFNEASAWAWAYELGLRLSGGLMTLDDFRVLRTARVLAGLSDNDGTRGRQRGGGA